MEGLVNASPFAAQELYLADRHGRDLLAVVVKATYVLQPGTIRELADEQVPVDLEGTYEGDPATSSPRYEPDVAPKKPATDVVLVGQAYADRPGATQVDVGFQVGAQVTRVLRVFGDRHWYTTMGHARISPPEPFERLPIQWERAFGGWDRTASDESKHRFEPRNPVGVGFRKGVMATVEAGAPLPNVEDPHHLIRGFKDTPPPAGLGFIAPHWAPRVSYAGTYDEAWEATRKPLLPDDFDVRFFNAAPPEQIVEGYLQGNEPVVLANLTPVPRLQTRLPNEPPPQVTVVQRGMADTSLTPVLDTVVFDTDAMQVHLTWRASTLLHRGAHGVQAVRVRPHASSRHAAPTAFTATAA